MSATHKLVNGAAVPLSAAEAAAIESEWAAHPPPTDQQIVERLRAAANAALGQLEDRQTMLLRALVLVLLDELNAHAAKINAILTAIDNGSTLAQVKSNIAAIADYPTRTAAQVRAALQDKVTNGDADG